jgi:nicotinamidase/pyrazinamidase
MSRTWIGFARALAFLAMSLFVAASQSADRPAGSRTALLVLDLQVDFVDPAGRFPIARDQIEPLLEAANLAIDAAARHHLPTAYIGNEYGFSDLPGNWFRHNAALKGAPGSALDPRLTRIETAPYFAKHQGDAFSNEALDGFLRSHEIGAIVLSGVYADACIYCTAKSAIERGYRVTILADAIGTASDDDRRAALRSLAGLGARIETVAAFAAQLDGKGG